MRKGVNKGGAGAHSTPRRPARSFFSHRIPRKEKPVSYPEGPHLQLKYFHLACQTAGGLIHGDSNIEIDLGRLLDILNGHYDQLTSTTLLVGGPLDLLNHTGDVFRGSGY